MDAKTIGKNIRGYRQSKQWTQARLGRAIRMDRANISRMEAGLTEPRMRTIRRLAKALQQPVARLVGD